MKFFSSANILFLKKNFQIVYAILLLILIPLAIVINSVVFVNNTQKVIDTELQRKALLAEKVFGSDLARDLANAELLQQRIENLAKNNEEIKGLDILIPEGENFKIAASLDKTMIGQVSKYLNNTIAWHNEEAIAFSTYSPALSTEKQEVSEFEKSKERFWVIVNPFYNEMGEKVGLVGLKISSKIIDDLARQNLVRSIIILVITVIIVILLLATNTRLFQYAVLFRRLKEVDQMKDEFISMASHELRTPITGIKGYLSMILDGTFGQAPSIIKEKLGLVSEATKRIDELVVDLLDVSRIQQGRIQLEIMPLNLSEAVKEILAELKGQAEVKGLQLIYEKPAEKLPLVRADEQKLKQVLVNLAGNAIKYTFKGKVTITSTPKEKTMEIKIADTGMGMSAKAKERLFEKFYRIKTKQTQNISGTGLGLWITKQLVEMMDGEIYVDSIEGVGTQVTVLLPIWLEGRKK